jgi:hypothetical protein
MKPLKALLSNKQNNPFVRLKQAIHPGTAA